MAIEHNGNYREKYLFTGKERDEETGLDYFGARYYDSRLGFWMSVDPLADKYPNVTPYLYCGGNPVMLVDPDGREVTNYLAPNDPLRPGALKYAQKHTEDQNESLTLFMHGSKGGVCRYDTQKKKYVLAGDGLNTLLNRIIQSKTWNDKNLKDKIIILNACSTGSGRENVAKKASEQLKGFLNNEKNDCYTGGDVYMVAPIAPVANDDEQQKQGWHLYKNGQQLRTKDGVDEMWFKGTPTEKEVKQWIQQCD